MRTLLNEDLNELYIVGSTTLYVPKYDMNKIKLIIDEIFSLSKKNNSIDQQYEYYKTISPSPSNSYKIETAIYRIGFLFFKNDIIQYRKFRTELGNFRKRFERADSNNFLTALENLSLLYGSYDLKKIKRKSDNPAVKKLN